MSIRLDEARIRLLNINGGIQPTVNNTYNLGTSSLKWANVYATTFQGALNGNATTSSYPYGFALYTSGATWGNTTGTSIACWSDSTGGSVDWRRDNPSSGKISMKVDGRVYVNEGVNPVMGMNTDGSYWCMGDPDGISTNWIRTTSLGIIPYQSGGSSSLGTSDWPFNSAYINTIYGNLSGNASTASKLATARTISLTGSVTGSGSFDGSGNLSITTTTNHTHNYAGSSSAGGIATSSYSLTNKGMLDTQDKIDNFLTSNKVEYATFKTSEANNVGMVSNDGMILSISWTHTTYGAQIAFDDDPSGLIKIRGKSTNWGNWYTLLHSGNYSDYTVTKTGSGASGNWGISITGNAATASKVNNVIPEWSGSIAWTDTDWIAAWNADGTKIKALAKSSFAAANHTHSYLPLGGGTMDSGARISHGGNLYIGTANNAGWIGVQDICSQDSLGDGIWSIRTNGNAIFQTCKGAVWNDYAEYRESDITEPGRCIIENGDDTLSLSTKRLQRGCEIVSDTFGFAIGETDKCKTPIVAAGRVLAYPYEDREEFRKHIGWPVCSGPNGTVSIMTEEEEKKYPSRIIGIISAIPDYETWGTGNVPVDGRIWIKVV